MPRCIGLVSTLLFLASLAHPTLSVAQTTAGPAALWGALGRPSLDSGKVSPVEHLELNRDAATIVLVNGQLALGAGFSTPAGEERVFHAAFKGTGRLQLAPSLPLEKQQLGIRTGEGALDAEFSEAVFVFTDSTAAEIAEQVTFRAGDTGGLQELLADRSQRATEYGLNWEPRLLKALYSTNSAAHELFVAELKMRDYGWLTLVVDAADPEQVELFELDTSRQGVDIWTKFPAGDRRPQEAFAKQTEQREYRVEGYKLDVTVEGNTDLTAQAEVQLIVQRGGERVMLLALDPNLRVAEVTTAEGQALAFFQPRDPKDDFFLADYLVVVSPEPFPLGRQTLRFRYAGERTVRKVGSGNFFCQSFGWYPTYGSGRRSLTDNVFAERYDFSFLLRVPKKYEVVATGQRVEEREEDKYRVTQWESPVPLTVAGFAFGNYKVHTQKVGETQVEVYANRQPDDILRSVEVFTGDTMPTQGGSRVGLSLGSLAPSRLAKEMANEVGNALMVFEKFYGPYPYDKLAVSNIPYSYGQGWPSLLYLSALSFLDSTQRQQLGITEHVQLTDFFRAHETSHQWWGHAVSWQSYHDQWLSEGFAEFSGILYTLFRRGGDEYRRLLRKNYEELAVRDRGGAVYDEIGPIYAGRRLSSPRHPGGYAVVVYNKGGWVLHMLRMMMFDPRDTQNPDGRFIAMMQDFTKTYFNRAASTEDFKAMVEKHMAPTMDLDGNGTMDWFFDSWVYGTGVPEYSLRYTIEPAAQSGQFVLSGNLQQSGVPDGFRSVVPVYLHVGKNSMRSGWIAVRGSSTPFEVTLGFRPDKVTINDWDEVLADVK